MCVCVRMKFSSKSIPYDSKVFWNEFRIAAPDSFSRIDFEIGSRIGSGIGIGSLNQNRPRNRYQFRHLDENRRLRPMLLRLY